MGCDSKIKGGGSLPDATGGVVVGAMTGAVHSSRKASLVLKGDTA